MEYGHKPVEFKHYPATSERGEAKLTIAVGPVIIEKDKVLLARHGKDDLWKFPGGSYIDRDNFPETAIRETREELGIEIRIFHEPFVFQFERNEEGIQEYVVLFHYCAKRAIVKKIEPREKGAKYDWFDINNLPENCAPNIEPAVKHFKKKLKSK